jgi:hypothetical protein
MDMSPEEILHSLRVIMSSMILVIAVVTFMQCGFPSPHKELCLLSIEFHIVRAAPLRQNKHVNQFRQIRCSVRSGCSASLNVARSEGSSDKKWTMTKPPPDPDGQTVVKGKIAR